MLFALPTSGDNLLKYITKYIIVYALHPVTVSCFLHCVFLFQSSCLRSQR